MARLRDVGLADGVLELALHGGFMEVMAGDPSGPGMRAEGGGGEDVLPAPFPGCVGIFAGQRFRHVDLARADREILQVFFAGLGEVSLSRSSSAMGSGTTRCLPPLPS